MVINQLLLSSDHTESHHLSSQAPPHLSTDCCHLGRRLTRLDLEKHRGGQQSPAFSATWCWATISTGKLQGQTYQHLAMPFRFSRLPFENSRSKQRFFQPPVFFYKTTCPLPNPKKSPQGSDTPRILDVRWIRALAAERIHRSRPRWTRHGDRSGAPWKKWDTRLMSFSLQLKWTD